MAETAPHAPELESRLDALHEASFGWALHCCDGVEEDAADVLQSAYLKVFSGRARFAGRSALRTWLFGVIRLTAMEFRRERSGGDRRGAVLAMYRESWPVPDPPDVVMDRAERARALEEALAHLSPRQREVLHLVFYQGMSIQEAAETMGVSVGSARVHYDRGKKRLRSLLGPGGTDDAVADEEGDDG